MDRDRSRDIRYRRVLAAAMALSLAAHGALLGLTDVAIPLPGDGDRSAAPDERAPEPMAETALKVVRLAARPAAGAAGGEGPGPSAAARDDAEAGRVELAAPSPRAGIATAAPSLEPVASERARPVPVGLTRSSADRLDPAVRAFRARMEARDDRVDYRAASRAARRSEGDRDRGAAVRGRYGGAGPGCENPATGGTDRSPYPVGGGTRR